VKRFVSVVAASVWVLASLATASPGSTAPSGSPGSPSGTATHGSTVHRGGTFVVGDSTTYRVAGLLREKVPDWYLDYHWGRSVKALPQHIKRYLKKDPDPSNFVMALGTNWCHDPEWSAARLRRAIGQLPRDTNVFLLTVVRAGAFQADKDRILRLYNGYSKDLARTRPHTYIVDWRKVVLADPTLDRETGLSSLLEDGTHQTGSPHGDTKGPGQRTYVDLVLSRWQQVNGQPPS
jgi:hypothetical protein